MRFSLVWLVAGFIDLNDTFFLLFFLFFSGLLEDWWVIPISSRYKSSFNSI